MTEQLKTLLEQIVRRSFLESGEPAALIYQVCDMCQIAKQALALLNQPAATDTDAVEDAADSHWDANRFVDRYEAHREGYRAGAALHALSQQWQPIETAPRDGSHLLLFRPDIRFTGYHAKAGWVINAPGLPLMEPAPTHWMPLPADPRPR